MKMNTLEKAFNALRDLEPEIILPEPLRARAELPIRRMLGTQPLSWPFLRDKFRLPRLRARHAPRRRILPTPANLNLRRG